MVARGETPGTETRENRVRFPIAREAGDQTSPFGARERMLATRVPGVSPLATIGRGSAAKNAFHTFSFSGVSPVATIGRRSAAKNAYHNFSFSGVSPVATIGRRSAAKIHSGS